MQYQQENLHLPLSGLQRRFTMESIRPINEELNRLHLPVTMDEDDLDVSVEKLLVCQLSLNLALTVFCYFSLLLMVLA